MGEGLGSNGPWQGDKGPWEWVRRGWDFKAGILGRGPWARDLAAKSVIKVVYKRVISQYAPTRVF